VVAFASNGADDGTQTTSTSTTSAGSTAKKLTSAQRQRAVRAARARVGASAKVLSVARRGSAIRVHLVRDSTRYDVRVSLAGKVRSVITSNAKLSDDPASHDAGDDHGTDDPAIHNAGDDHGSGGHGSDDGPNHS
jgi:hypothetical protein